MYANFEPALGESGGSVPRHVDVRSARPDEEAWLLSTLTSAFVIDPPARWLYPEARDYFQFFPMFARAFGGSSLALGTSWCTQDLGAVACWFPPHTGPDDDALTAVIENSIPERRHATVFAVFEAMAEAHPCEPHWYLPLIGVDPVCQGNGLGSAVLRKTLAMCDEAGLPAYLEASSPRSVPLYERFGFRCRQSIRIGGCPPVTPMWRDATRAVHS